MTQKLASTISIVLNTHREGELLIQTMASMDAAVALVRKQGVAVELVAVLDNANDITRNVLANVSLAAYTSSKIIEVRNGSLGLSRNDGIEASSGEFIFLADADDLISSNYFLATLECAAQSARRTLYFPELLFGFGDNYHITQYADLSRTGITSFLKHHPYISRVSAHRSLFNEIKFHDMRLSEGHAYEDWHFNCEAIAAGYDLKVVSDVILFYRQRAGSLLRSADALSSRQIAPSALFRPTRFTALCAAQVDTTERDVQDQDISSSRLRESILQRENVRNEIALAFAIEPLMDPRHFSRVPMFRNYQNSAKSGIVYLEVAKVIGDNNYSDIFFVPFLSKGGAEKFVIQVMHAISRINPLLEILVISGENYSGVSAENDLPPNVTLVNLPLIDSISSIEDRCLIALKAIERHPSSARLHFLSSVFSAKMIERYATLLAVYRCYFYRFNNVERNSGGKLVVTYSPLDFIKRYISLFERIVCDSEIMLRRDIADLPEHRSKWRLLHAHVTQLPTMRRRLRKFPVDHVEPLRVLWASRFDEQKRPELLPLIAAALERSSLPVQIDAYGFSVFSKTQGVTTMRSSSLKYCGPFLRFSDVSPNQYDAFLYTSWNDGVPNVVLEAGAAGLPVIAPNVGGIGEVIRNEHTGILLESLESDAEMAEAYVSALRRFVNEPDLSDRLSNGLSALLDTTFGVEQHEKSVREIFALTPYTPSAEDLSNFYLSRARSLRNQYVLEKTWAGLSPKIEGGALAWTRESRAHALAARYIVFAQGNSLGAKALRLLKALIRPIWHRVRR